MSKVKIMVAAHKKFPMPEDKELYLPVLVGAVNNYKPGIDYQRDDDGENISDKNPNYNELTAVYWAWRNLDSDVEAVGLVHYRRLFSLTKKRTLGDVLTKEETDQLLESNSAILPTKRKYYIETMYSHYVHSHKKEPLDVTRNVLKQLYPEYVFYFDKVMNSKSAHMFNMFVMKRKVFDEYAEWLFDVLGNVEQLIDISNYSKQEARVFGYISELLLDVWIYKNKIDYKEIPWIQLGDRKLIAKYASFLGRKILPNKVKSTHF